MCGRNRSSENFPTWVYTMAWPDLRAPSLPPPPARACIIHLLNLFKIRRGDAGSVFRCEINTGLCRGSGVCVFIMRSVSYAHTISQSSVASMSVPLSDATVWCFYLESQSFTSSYTLDVTRSVLISTDRRPLSGLTVNKTSATGVGVRVGLTDFDWRSEMSFN